MTGMLASVNCVAEALLVLEAGVDIIDLKQPALGALGALDIIVVQEIVTEVNQRCPVSATIGDLPMQPQVVFNAVKAMAETGVDYVKIGFFPGGNNQFLNHFCFCKVVPAGLKLCRSTNCSV